MGLERRLECAMFQQAVEASRLTSGDARDHEIARLFEDQYPSMVRLAFLLTIDSGTSEDIAQEAFVRLWRSWGKVRKRESTTAYLRSTVVNLSRSSLRSRIRERRRMRAPTSPYESHESDPSMRVDMSRVLRKLPVRQRACVVLRFYEDLTEVETAQVLGVTEGTIKSQMHKAMKHLERELGGEKT